MSATAAAGFSPAQRSVMFYAICIPLRLSLVAVLYGFGSNVIVRSTAVVGGLASYFHLSKQVRESAPSKGVWWCRPMHMISGALISVLFVISPRPTIPSTILLMDTIAGLATSLYKKPFHKNLK